MKISFKYVVLSILCLILVNFASFQIQSTDIRVYVQEDGSAKVTEDFTIYIQGDESIKIYEESSTTLSRNNIQSWFYKLQLPNLIYHIGGQQVNIENLVIIPEPVQKIYDNGYTIISISYNVLPSSKFNNETDSKGLFVLKNIKPRTTQYTLNKFAFLDTNENGDLILPQNTKLTFLLPEGAKITSINPVPDSLRDTLPPYYISTIFWSKPIMPKFMLEFEIEETLEYEIVEFFYFIQTKITELIKGSEGVPIIIIIIIIVLSVFYIHKITKKD
ncbi:hypothetical protein KO317_00705 [Candidatus Micrarchaeota archaeon]|nr:hypothetical protein [Candidatus Micrarchaeota archaeon]